MKYNFEYRSNYLSVFMCAVISMLEIIAEENLGMIDRHVANGFIINQAKMHLRFVINGKKRYWSM